MDFTLAIGAMSTPSLVLRYTAAFFFVVVAIALAYALIKAAKALDRVDKVLADVDEQGIPLMQKAGSTLDGVNANLGNVDEITKDVAGITDKLDTMATAVEGAVTTPARKAAAFSAGVQSAVSSFIRRDKGDDGKAASEAGASAAAAAGEPAWGGTEQAPAAQPTTDEAAQPSGDEAAAAPIGDEAAAPAPAAADEPATAAAGDGADDGAEAVKSEGSPWDSPAS